MQHRQARWDLARARARHANPGDGRAEADSEDAEAEAEEDPRLAGWLDRWGWTPDAADDSGAVAVGILDFLLYDDVPVDDEFRDWILAAACPAPAGGGAVARAIATGVRYVEGQLAERRREPPIPDARPLSERDVGAPYVVARFARERVAFGGSRVAVPN